MKDIMDFLGSTCCDDNQSGSIGPSEPDYGSCTCLNKLPLAYSYTPMQELDTLYDYTKALESGTVFPELDLPAGVYGNNFCKKGDL